MSWITRPLAILHTIEVMIRAVRGRLRHLLQSIELTVSKGDPGNASYAETVDSAGVHGEGMLLCLQ